MNDYKKYVMYVKFMQRNCTRAVAWLDRFLSEWVNFMSLSW